MRFFHISPSRVKSLMSLPWISQSRPCSTPTSLSISHIAPEKRPLTTNESDKLHDEIPKWPTKPQCLHRDMIYFSLGCIGDALMFVFSSIFFIYGVFVLHADGRPISSISRMSMLSDASKYGPSVFPIVFAAVVGTAMRNIALWKLEQGSRLMTLDQLLGSQTFFSTITTQIKHRRISWGGALLIVLWALSPLGGQASLRVLELSFKRTPTSIILPYLDLNSTLLPGQKSLVGDAEDIGVTQDVDDAKVSSALAASHSSKISAMDGWGNIKVPMIEDVIHRSLPDAEGWYSLSDLQPTYSSLIGVPTAELDQQANFTFKMESYYINLNCTRLDRPSSGYVYFSTENPDAGGGRVRQNRCWGLANLDEGFDIKTLFSESTPVDGPSDPSQTGLYYNSFDDDGKMTYAECSKRMTYVELDVFCHGQNCTTVRIRDSKQPHPQNNLTILDWTPSLGVVGSISNFGGCGMDQMPTKLQRYFIDPDTPFNTAQRGPPLYELSKESFSLSLYQLLNTVYIAGVGLTSIAGKMPRRVPSSNIKPDISTQKAMTTIATVTTGKTVVICNRKWLAALFVATSMIFITGVFGLVLECMRRGPDLEMNISSMTRDNPFVVLPPGGSALDSVDRSRLLAEARVQFGDVAPTDPVGYLALASCGGSQYVQKPRSGRLYA